MAHVDKSIQYIDDDEFDALDRALLEAEHSALLRHRPLQTAVEIRQPTPAGLVDVTNRPDTLATVCAWAEDSTKRQCMRAEAPIPTSVQQQPVGVLASGAVPMSGTHEPAQPLPVMGIEERTPQGPGCGDECMGKATLGPGAQLAAEADALAVSVSGQGYGPGEPLPDAAAVPPVPRIASQRTRTLPRSFLTLNNGSASSRMPSGSEQKEGPGSAPGSAAASCEHHSGGPAQAPESDSIAGGCAEASSTVAMSSAEEAGQPQREGAAASGDKRIPASVKPPSRPLLAYKGSIRWALLCSQGIPRLTPATMIHVHDIGRTAVTLACCMASKCVQSPEVSRF